jgi:hypothetical protein
VDAGNKPRTTFPYAWQPHYENAPEKLSALDGVSMNQFINLAVAEKVSRLEAQMHHQPVLVKDV